MVMQMLVWLSPWTLLQNKNKKEKHHNMFTWMSEVQKMKVDVAWPHDGLSHNSLRALKLEHKA